MIKYLKKIELIRRIWHFLAGMVISFAYFYNFLSREWLILLLTTMFLFVIIIEYLRAENRKLNKICANAFNLIIRKKELKGISGIPFYLFGCLFSIFVFNKTIAILSILYLAIGDPVAGFSGRMFGKYSFKFKNGKSLIGFLAAFLVCSIITYGYSFFIGQFFYSNAACIVFSVLAGFGAAFSEVVSFIDDNFSVPVISGIILYCLFSFFGHQESLINILNFN